MSDPRTDPFGERAKLPLARDLRLLGGEFRFETNSAVLLELVEQAFADLPGYRLASPPRRFNVRLILRARPAGRRKAAPPVPRLSSGAGFLCATFDADNYAVLYPAQRRACIAVSTDLLAFSHLVRYELIEFAVLTLAARSLELVALHGACVGEHGRGVLLVGDSGTGKSTVALESLLGGLEFLSEDSVFVTPDSLRAIATPNFLHLRTRERAARPELRAALRNAALIRRRSGERKYALDVRGGEFRIAPRPLSLAAIVFLSRRRAAGTTLLSRVARGNARRRLRELQPYAAGRPEWGEFARGAARLPAFELRRGATPAHAVAELRALVAAPHGGALDVSRVRPAASTSRKISLGRAARRR